MFLVESFDKSRALIFCVYAAISCYRLEGAVHGDLMSFSLNLGDYDDFNEDDNEMRFDRVVVISSSFCVTSLTS